MGIIDLQIDVDLLDEKESVAIKKSAKALLHKIIAKGPHLNTLRKLWPAAYGKPYKQLAPILVLVPLDRIGGEPGKSGNRVLIGYFKSGRGRRPPSPPLIVKVGQHSLVSGHYKDCLKQEKNNADTVFGSLQFEHDAFALPIDFTSHQQHSILWSQLVVGQSLESSQNHRLTNLSVNDYLKVLRTDSQYEKQRELLSKAFKILDDIHGHPPRIQKKKIILEYKRYLRGVEDDGSWGEQWKFIWGRKSEEGTRDLGGRWTNPFWTLSKLSRLGNQKLRCGTVHGDFHPRNIVLTNNCSPKFIDFGWAQKNAHIAKDYALLECNLRFVALRPDVPIRDLVAMAKWAGLNQRPPKVESSYCRERVSLIESLRQIVKEKFGEGLEAEREYSWSLFLIALGLLKHIHHFDNQIAARLTVLSLASHVARKVYVAS